MFLNKKVRQACLLLKFQFLRHFFHLETLGKPNLVEPPKDPDTDLGFAQDDLPDQVVEVETTSKDQKHQMFNGKIFNNKASKKVYIQNLHFARFFHSFFRYYRK